MGKAFGILGRLVQRPRHVLESRLDIVLEVIPG